MSEDMYRSIDLCIYSRPSDAGAEQHEAFCACNRFSIYIHVNLAVTRLQDIVSLESFIVGVHHPFIVPPHLQSLP